MTVRYTKPCYSSIVLIIGYVLQASSVREATNVEQFVIEESLSNQSDMKAGCPCLQQNVCSSCAEGKLEKCPFGDISSVQAFTGGGTASVAGVAAWSVTAANGRKYVVKFGGPMSSGLQAAQIAHTLHVTTPRQILVNKESCPKLWSKPERFAKEWGQSLPAENHKMVSIQEHAASTTPEGLEPKAGSIKGSFWYQAGAIAALDWIIGKSDLFNDVSYGWQDSANEYAEVKDTNLDNIYLTSTGIVAIDLDMNMGATRWEYWREILGEIIAGEKDITWFNKVMLPMLALRKKDITLVGTEAFGPFNVENMNGWDSKLSPALTHLGFVDTLAHAMKITEYQKLPGLQHASDFSKHGLMQKLNGHSKDYKEIVVERQKFFLGKIYKCCEIKCDKPGMMNMYRNDCPQTQKYHRVKLAQGEKPYKYGSIMYNAFAKYNGDPNEPDCERAAELRPSGMMEKYCECGKTASKDVRISMTTTFDEDKCSID